MDWVRLSAAKAAVDKNRDNSKAAISFFMILSFVIKKGPHDFTRMGLMVSLLGTIQ